MQINKEVSAKCLCGSVTITINNYENEFGACHCDMCKIWTGSPQMAFGCKDLKVDGDEFVEKYSSSEWAERAFCKKCGTHLFYKVKDANTYRPLLGLFKDSISPEFKYQYFIDNKPSNYSFKEDTTDLTTQQIMEYYGQK